MKRLYLLIAFCLLLSGSAFAQLSEAPADKAYSLKAFNHLDVSFTAGTTGLGFDLAMPIGDYVQVRTGLDFMPHFKKNMDFGIQVGEDPAQSQSKFNRLQGMLSTLTGYSVDNTITMEGHPTFWNWKLLVDVFPFKENKHWHVTAGFYLGPAHIATAENIMADMPSLMAVGIYNNLYDKVAASPVINDPYYFMDHTAAEVLDDISLLQALGWQSPEALQQISLDPDNNPVKNLYDRIYNYGKMSIHMGDYVERNADGTVRPYRMKPDANSMVSARIRVNRFKPYLGFGYGGRLIKNNDSYKVSFDCGLLFWGSTPSIVTHEGVDLAKDVENIGGKVGRYVDVISKFKVYPVLNFRISKRIF